MSSNLKIKLVKDLRDAEVIWHHFYSNKNLFEEWNFRYLFYKYFNYELFFYVAYCADEPKCLLPLQYNTDEGYLEFFGGTFMYNNKIYTRPEFDQEVVAKLLKSTEKPFFLESMTENEMTKSSPFSFYCYLYTLDISNMSSYEDYLREYHKSESRGKIKRKIKKLENDYKIEMLVNNYSDLDLLMDINIKNFGSGSAFLKPHRKQIFYDLLNSGYEVSMLTLLVDGEKKSVSISVKYNDCYHFINVGNEKTDIPNIGVYMNLQNIQKAIDLKCKILDAGMDDLGWKELWHLEKHSLYFLRNTRERFK